MFISIGLAGCYFYFENQKETSLVSESEPTTEPLSSEETPTIPRPKRSLEEEKPKIKTTNARLEKIKNYLFTENANLSYLPSDLLNREIEEINKLKKSWGLSLGYLNRKKGVIVKEQNKCDEHQSRLNLILPKITSLEQQKLKLEEQLKTKEKELDGLKIDRKTNENKIDKLNEEILGIVGKIGKIKNEIKNLQADQEMYQNILNRAKKLKKDLEERYKITETEKKDKNLIISQLNELYEIV
ncbi:MAG: effector [Candidatus Phytoplasma stylosanthis]|nr:effector [Candidatus Phytoplasma stylosanthis]